MRSIIRLAIIAALAISASACRVPLGSQVFECGVQMTSSSTAVVVCQRVQ